MAVANVKFQAYFWLGGFDPSFIESPLFGISERKMESELESEYLISYLFNCLWNHALYRLFIIVLFQVLDLLLLLTKYIYWWKYYSNFTDDVSFKLRSGRPVILEVNNIRIFYLSNNLIFKAENCYQHWIYRS